MEFGKYGFFILFFCIGISVFSQESSFQYTGEIGFGPDSAQVNPYLITVDGLDNIWIASSSATDTNAVDALYKASPGDTVFQLVKQYQLRDSVRSISGIASYGTDIYVISRISSDEFYYPYSQMKFYPEGDPEQEVVFHAPNDWDYGSWLSGLDATNDGYLFAGRSYLVTIVSYDGRQSSSNFGQTVGASVHSEPGGDLTYPNVMDLIRDVAVDPDAEYGVAGAPVYTSRNSSSEGTTMTGGIATWSNGTQTAPTNFASDRITDADGFLTWDYSAPYGIAVQPNTSYLFACGTDSSRRWVKGFQVSGSFAMQADELPSSTSKDELTRDPDGAPFKNPSDVAFSSEGMVAYVADQGTNSVFVFAQEGSDLTEDTEGLIPGDFTLYQNHPNPFNPVTNIQIRFPAQTSAKVIVYNSRGEVVKTLADRVFPSGTSSLDFIGNGLASGVYFVTVRTEQSSQIIKMVLLQ